MEVVPGKGARVCECRKAEEKTRLIAAIPDRFAGVSLETLKPDQAYHPKQFKVIEVLRSEPEASYFIAGRAGVGKTMMLWALYRHAVEKGERRVVCCTLSNLLEEYRALYRAVESGTKPELPRLTAEMLDQGERKYAVFLDDLDKAVVTDWAGEQVYRLMNTIYERGHQLVVTSNKSIDDLRRQYSKRDETLGEPIVRRMTDDATVVEFF